MQQLINWPVILALSTGAVPALAQSQPYRYVVADARTRAALPAATVQADDRTLRTDEAGRFGLPERPKTLQISHVGYQPRQWQAPPAADTLWLLPQAVALPGVRVRAQLRVAEWRHPGKVRWPHDTHIGTLLPGRQVAVLYQPADSARTYRIRAVRLRLGNRFPENPAQVLTDRRAFPQGRLRVSLVTPGPDGTPDGTLGLTQWTITPEQSAQHQDGWLRLPLPPESALLVPASGVFVVAASLTTTDAETAVRTRLLEYNRRHPEQGTDFQSGQKLRKGATLNQFVEIQPAGGGASRLVLDSEFPAIAQRTAPNDAGCHSWHTIGQRWYSLLTYSLEMRKRFPTHDYLTHNYELVLEVEEL